MNNNSDKHIIILGAGPAGLSSAYFYNEKGYKVTLIEKSSEIGGLSRGIEFQNKKYDLGPHSFYSNYQPITKSIFEKFIGKENFTEIKTSKLIQSEQVLFQSPLKPKDLRNIPNLRFLFSHLFSKINARLARQNGDTSFESIHGKWALENIYKPYCNKYFNIDYKEVSDDFVQLLYSNKKEKTKDTILVPNSGYIGILWERIYDDLKKSNIEIILNDSVQSIQLENNSIIEINTSNRKFTKIHKLISTIPLSQTYKLIFPDKKYNFNLKTRASIIVFLEVYRLNTKALFLTNYTKNDLIGRINFSSNWNKKNSKKVVSIEIWCDKNESIFNENDERILSKIETALMGNSSFESDYSTYKVIRLANCFPVLEKNYSSQLQKIKQEFEPIKNLTLAGRQGNFMWDGIDDSINNAHKLANE